MNHGKKIYTFVAIALLVSGCLSTNKTRIKINYYTIEYGPPVIEKHPAYPLVIRIASFRAVRPYDGTKIVYQEQPFEKAAYHYHRWQAKPTELVTNLLKRDLQHTGLFTAVVGPDSRARAAYAIEGFIEDFFELDTAGQCTAMMTLNINVVPEDKFAATTPVLFQKRYSIQTFCKKKHPRALAEAMSRALLEISSAIISDISASLSTRTEQYNQ